MACEISVKINNNIVFTAHNDMELDGWIASHQELLSEGLEIGFQKIYSLDSVEETLKKIDNITAEFKAFEKKKNAPDNVSVAVTTLWTLFGNPVNPAQPLFSFKGVAKKNAVEPKDVGNDVDNVCNSYFWGKKPNTPMYLDDKMILFVQDTLKKRIMPTLTRDYGLKISDPKRQIIPQYQMIMRSMNDDFKQVIKESSKEFESGKVKHMANEISVIEGVADLVIIDDYGVVHLVDFKTWHGTELDPQVKNKYFAQLTTYQEMLRSYGIPVGQAFIIGFNTDYDDDPDLGHIRLKSLDFYDSNIIRVPNSDRYVQAVRDALWKNTTVTENTISNLGEVLTLLFPSTKIANRLQARDVDYKFMVQNAIREVDRFKDSEAWDKGYRFYFWRNRSITGEPRSERVYGITLKSLTEDTVDESGKIKPAPLKVYFDQVNKKKMDRFNNLAKELMYAMQIHDLDTFEESITTIAPSNTDTLLHHFKRYILCNWKFKENTALNANGIYLFEKGDKLEIVVIDEENLINGKVDLLHGNTILGNFVKDSKATDGRTVMSNDYGNLMLMKACALLALDPELTKNKKVSNIKALNLHNARVYEENPNRLITSWNLLAQQYNESYPERKKLRTLGYNTFMNDAKALVDIADEYIELLYQGGNKKYANLVKQREKDLELTRETLLERIDSLQYAERKLRDLRKGDYQDESWTAYAYLRRALLYLEGINIFQERDLGAVIQGINLTGIKMRSFNDSNSALARQMGELMARFRTAVRLEFVKQQFTWSKLIDAAYKEEGTTTGIIGNDWSFFESWFEKDETGKVNKSFRLLRPTEFKKTHGPATVKAYEYFLETNAKYRWPNEQVREEMRDTDQWYEVPMLKAGFLEHFTGGKPLGAIRSSWEKYKDASIGMIMGNPDVEKVRAQFEEIDVDALPNVIDKDSDARDAFIEHQGGAEGLEKNLDFVFLSMLYSGVRAERSPLFCELFTSFLVATDYMMDTSGLDIQTIRDAMTQFVQSKLFSRDIRPVEEKNLNALVGLLKSITAKVALGWNTRAFFREILTGQKKHINRWIAGAEKSNPFVKGTKKWFESPEFLDYSDFVEAYVDVVAKIADNMDIFSFYSQLNAIYGMVNFSNEEMAEASQRHQWTVLGLSDKSSVTATAPDFLHRMAILAGHLKTIGAFDAHSIEESTGRLIYDMTKDNRFKTWLKYKDDESKIPNLEERRKFNQEKQVYMEELASWHTIEVNLNYGDMLPQALSPLAVGNVKGYADQQYGNYDEETKSLIQKQTLGSLFFQYKTYGLAQFALWFAEPGYTNRLSYVYVLNNDGKKIVQIPVKTQEELEQHGDFIEKPEDEVTEEEWQRKGTKYKKQLGGDLFIGKAQSTALLAAKLFSLNGDEFLDLWNSSPEFRTNLYLSMLDLLEFALIGLLLRLFWGTDDTPIYRQGFIERWTYGVISGMSTDGPLFQTLQGITGDGTPPVFGMIKNYYRTMHSVITGNQNLLYGLTNTVGMTRELSNLFRTK